MSSSVETHTAKDSLIPRALRWTTAQFYRMGEMGLFDDTQVELIDGEIIEMIPIGSGHAGSTARLDRLFQRLFGDGYLVRIQSPLDLGEGFQPQPDVVIVAGDVDTYDDHHPTSPLLVVEVSETTLEYDRADKAAVYARAGIQEYWIVNLINRQLEVHRTPGQRTDSRFGFGYLELTILPSDARVSPLVAPQATIAVADLLTKAR